MYPIFSPLLIAGRVGIVSRLPDQIISAEILRADQLQFLAGKQRLIWVVIGQPTVYAVRVGEDQAEKLQSVLNEVADAFTTARKSDANSRNVVYQTSVLLYDMIMT